MKRCLLVLAFLFVTISAFGDISVTERASTARIVAAATAHAIAGEQLTQAERDAIRAANQAKRDAKHKKQHPVSDGIAVQGFTPEQRAAIRAANQAKRDAKHAKQHPTASSLTTGRHITTHATGSVSLIDASGLKYFIDTNITFNTTSSASGSASEASFTHSVAASTSGGGVTMSTLNDAYDGYNTICVSLTGGTGPCATGSATYAFYNQTGGPAVVDATVPAIPTCTGRQYVLPAKTIGPLSVRRKIFVPTNDSFVRWLNFFTNTTGAPVTFNMITGNNLGSDSNTRIVSSSSGDNAAQLTDTWVTTFQNYSGNSSSDPRLGHVLQGVGATTPLSIIHFADGDDNPFWGYTITLAPGETKIIMNFGVGQPTKALANSKSTTLATKPASATQCMSATELSQVSNFAPANIPTLSGWMLAMLALALATVGFLVLSRRG